MNVRDTGELKEAYRGWVEEALEGSGLERRPEWTESKAVGSESFLRAINERLGIRAKGRKVAGGESRFELREGFAPYFHVFRGENVDLNKKTPSFGGKYLENQRLSLVRPQQRQRDFLT